LPASHTGAVVVIFAHRAPTTTTASEAPYLGLEVVALQRLKTTTSGIQMRKRLGVPVVVSQNRTQKQQQLLPKLRFQLSLRVAE